MLVSVPSRRTCSSSVGGPDRGSGAYLGVVLSRSRHLRMRGPRSAAALAIGFGAAVLFTAAAPDARSDHVSSSGLRHNCVWRATPSADPHPFLYDRFNSVAGISPREAWAVGDYFTGHEGGPHGAFIERWNGRRWRVA